MQNEKSPYASEISGALRESIGTKIDTTLVPYELIVSAAIGLNYGAQKYSERNFERGLSYSSLLGSIERHNKAIMDGEYFDAESGLPHYTLLASCVAMLCHNIMQSTVIDNRPPAKGGNTVSVLAVIGQTILTNRLQDMPQPSVGINAVSRAR